MRTTVLSSFLFIILTLSFAGCTKKHEVNALPPSVESQLMSADQQIRKMLDDLNNRNVALQYKREILCDTYPNVYKKQYMPALLKLSPRPYSEETLLRDFEAEINFYKKAWSIKCT